MSLNLSTKSLRSILSLSEKRDELVAKLAEIDAEITSALGGSAKPAIVNALAGKPAKSPVGKSKKRGAVKALILGALKEAGHAGIAVKDLSKKLGLKNTSVHVWFGTTGKTIKEIQKTGKGIYRLASGTPEEAPAKPAKVKVKKARKPAVRKSAKKA